MDWWLILAILFGSLLFLMVLGIPVAFCFLAIEMIGVYMLMGGTNGFVHLTSSLFNSVSSYSFLPAVLFMIMGDVMLHSNIAPNMVDTVDRWLGRLPGRLGLVTVGTGVLFSTLTGTSMGSVAMIGKALVPEMEKRGYKKAMSLGPIIGAGGLAVLIPPSGLGVITAVIAEIPVGSMLLSSIVPGIILAATYSIYIIVRCWLQPSIAPPYAVAPTPMSEKLILTAKYIAPVAIIIFLVIGIMFLGVATAIEAAATGTLGMYLLAAAYKRLSWQVLKKSLSSAIYTAGMVLLIMAMAKGYSEILAFSGASRSMVTYITDLGVSPLLFVSICILVFLVLGMFMSQTPVLLIVMPIFMPVVRSLGLSDLWFGTMTLIMMEMASITPPFGLSLFTLKAVATPDTRMGDVIRAALPFIGMQMAMVILIMFVPVLALWLPGSMLK